MPSSQFPTHPWAGCAECEYDRLRRWAIDNGVIDNRTNPVEMVTTIIKLVSRMDERIKELQTRVYEQAQEHTKERVEGINAQMAAVHEKQESGSLSRREGRSTPGKLRMG